MANLLELAQMSAAVYESKTEKGSKVNGWACTRFQRASGSLSGFQGGIFTKKGETVVAFRGTDQAMDIVVDLKLGAGMNTSYYYLGQKLASLASGSNIIVTGHSLGGAIAQVVANRGGFVMASFNAPGVGVISSRNMAASNPIMNVARVSGMLASAVRHPMQAVSDVRYAFRSVKGVNLCLKNDVVSMIGNHYGLVRRIRGTSMNPKTEHGIATVISVLEKPENRSLAARTPGSF